MVPELAGQAHTDVAEFVTAGREMLRATPHLDAPLMVLGTAEHAARITPMRHDLRRFGLPIAVGSPTAPVATPATASTVPSSVLIGWWWAHIADRTTITDAAVITDSRTHAPHPQSLATTARWLHPQLSALHAHNGTLLIIADGPAALHPTGPIPLRPSAVSLNASLSSFLDDGISLIHPDPATAAADGWYSQPGWILLDWLCHGTRPTDTAHCAPFGVGYHAAHWTITDIPELPATEHHRGNAHHPPIIIIGPTGSGKSALALALAERLGGEIVNIDAMQMYRGMDIGTAKVPVSERRGIAHHLLDVLDVTDTATVADYHSLAVAAVEDIIDRGARPIIVGGSMMYYQSLVDQWQFPATDDAVRQRYETLLAERGTAALHGELARIDPAAAASILPTDARRIVRALEVIELTGAPFAASRPAIGAPRWGAQILGLSVDLPVLDERLKQRTEAMFADGLVTEVRALERAGLRTGITARRAIGYAHVLAALDATTHDAAQEHDAQQAEGELSTDTLAALREDVYIATRRYVRRQRSWFRRDPRVRWLDATSGRIDELTAAALDALGYDALGFDAPGYGPGEARDTATPSGGEHHE